MAMLAATIAEKAHANSAAYQALAELKKWNPIRNDLDAYLLEVAEWVRQTNQPLKILA